MAFKDDQFPKKNFILNKMILPQPLCRNDDAISFLLRSNKKQYDGVDRSCWLQWEKSMRKLRVRFPLHPSLGECEGPCLASPWVNLLGLQSISLTQQCFSGTWCSFPSNGSLPAACSSPHRFIPEQETASIVWERLFSYFHILLFLFPSKICTWMRY